MPSFFAFQSFANAPQAAGASFEDVPISAATYSLAPFLKASFSAIDMPSSRALSSWGDIAVAAPPENAFRPASMARAIASLFA